MYEIHGWWNKCYTDEMRDSFLFSLSKWLIIFPYETADDSGSFSSARGISIKRSLEPIKHV